MAGVTLLAVEIGLRIAAPWLAPLPEWGWNRDLGCVQIPGSVFEDGGLRIEHNHLGFRDVEHRVEKPAGTRRIVFIGDSFTEAEGVNLEDTYWKQLETMLNAHPGAAVRWEAINLAVSDFGTAQEAIALERHGLAYSPDVVVHQIFALNDIANNTIEFAGLNASMTDGYRPYFVQEASGLAPARAEPLRNAVRNGLVTFRLLERLWNVARYGTDDIYAMLALHDQRMDDRLRAAGMPRRCEIDTYAPDELQDPRTRRGWRVTEKLCERIVSTCRRRGVPLVTVLMPFEGFVGHAKEAFLDSRPDIRPGYAERRLARLYERLGVPCLDLWSVFDADEQSFHPALGGHLNLTAHRVAAERLLALLESAGIVR